MDSSVSQILHCPYTVEYPLFDSIIQRYINGLVYMQILISSTRQLSKNTSNANIAIEVCTALSSRACIILTN